MNTQTLFIEEISVPITIGVHEVERAKKQELLIDLDLSFDANKAASTDDIKDTINYEQLTYDLRDLAMQTSFELVEALAKHIIDWIHATHPEIKHIKIKIKKQGVFPNAKAYGIIQEISF